ncbi:hypothetical protein EVAR_17395_1 [Eumeta japonica]|uniref:Uncharacterized protein n=1 Tax=Eumeta variegata TaxID=151549 RepID=A0A4C1VC55_EUMVA|nr:hypothetical protein EVAR_17395_1 [Eumeta japonica]
MVRACQFSEYSDCQVDSSSRRRRGGRQQTAPQTTSFAQCYHVLGAFSNTRHSPVHNNGLGGRRPPPPPLPPPPGACMRFTRNPPRWRCLRSRY